MKKTCIMVVDDEASILRYVSGRLRKEGYEVVTASDGEEALLRAEEENPALVLLDINMPKLDGFGVCQRLREWSEVPIIMLSARADETDKVKCLNLGADDYLTKPFGTEELMARVRSVLRRTKEATVIPTQASFSNGYLNISFAERRVTVGGKEVRLTPTEYNLLQELVLNVNKVLTHRMLLGKVWGPEYWDEKEYLHVFMGRLRNKLEPDPAHPMRLITVAGVGYQFRKQGE